MADLSDVYSALQKADAAGDTASAQQLADYIRSQSAAPAETAPAAAPSSSGVGRQLALQARAAAEGVVSPAATFTPSAIAVDAWNAANWLSNKLGGHHAYAPTPAEMGSQALTNLGVPEPTTSGEKLASAATSGLTGGLLTGGAGVPGVANALRGGAAGLMGGLSQEGARQIGLPTWLQVGAGLLGAQAPALGESVVRTVGDLAAPLTKAGQSRAAGTLLNSQAQDAPTALQNLLATKPLVKNSAPTAGASSQDTGILGIEKAVRGTSAPDFAERISDQNAARQGALTQWGGTPQDLQNAIAMRAKTTAPLYAAAATQAAPVDNELTALMQRPLMQSAMKQAQDLQANRGNTFGLQTYSPGSPMSITGSDAQAIKMALDDMRTNGAVQGIGAHQKRALQGTIDAFNDWTGRNIPGQRAADSAFENLSAPVNKMQTIQALQQKASTTAADMRTGNYFLSPAGYSRALDEALEEPRNGLDKVDVGRLEALRKDLQNSQAVNSPLLKAPGSDTFQNLSLNQNISGLANVLTKPLAPLYRLGGADSAVNKLLTQAMLDPHAAAGLMQLAAKPKPGLNFRPFDLGTVGGLLGSAP